MKYCMDIRDAIVECSKRYEKICFILEGNAFLGDVIHSKSADSECVSISDRMIYGSVSSSIPSYRFVVNRIKANTLKKDYQNSVEDILSINNLKESKYENYVLFQFDFLLDDIWKLFLLSFLEKNKKAEYVFILKYLHEENTVKTNFEKVYVKGAYYALKNIICKRKKIPAEQYGVSEETVDFMIDINNKKSKVLEHIFNHYIDEKDLKKSYFNFRSKSEFSKYGLSEFDFYKLMYEFLIVNKKEKIANDFLKNYFKK